jgi:hypothetical protein
MMNSLSGGKCAEARYFLDSDFYFAANNVASRFHGSTDMVDRLRIFWTCRLPVLVFSVLVSICWILANFVDQVLSGQTYHHSWTWLQRERSPVAYWLSEPVYVCRS